MMFDNSLVGHLSANIQQGNYGRYKDLFLTIVKIHRKTFTEENLPTAEDAILEAVNEALDKMWEREGCVRDMAVYKTFIAKREARLEEEKQRLADLDKQNNIMFL